jgi:hypothetical protein
MTNTAWQKLILKPFKGNIVVHAFPCQFRRLFLPGIHDCTIFNVQDTGLAPCGVQKTNCLCLVSNRIPRYFNQNRSQYYSPRESASIKT